MNTTSIVNVGWEITILLVVSFHFISKVYQSISAKHVTRLIPVWIVSIV